MSAPEHFAFVREGFVVLYHQGESNRCPACGQAQWHVSRSTAECAFCKTALPLAQPIDATQSTIEPLAQERN